MMELFVRIAIQKYYKTKIASSYLEAIKKLFINELLPYIQNFDCHLWRSQYLWCESCDIILKSYLPVLKMLYKKKSGRYTKPGH